MDVGKAMDLIQQAIDQQWRVREAVKCTGKNIVAPTRVTLWALKHLIFVAATAREMVQTYDHQGELDPDYYRVMREKLMRWVGFAQGAAWALGLFSVDELRGHGR